ncbi:MAG: hypothetical protein KC609_10205 [Myxococcales bacterium]|nr:hypothetical protein [Myxococcales bacterium]
MSIKRTRRVIARAAWRIRLLRANDGILAGAIIGAIAACAWLLAVKLDQLPSETLQWLWAVAAAPAIGALIGLAWRVDSLTVAERVDRSNGLKDRLGSALVFDSLADRSALMELAIRDAERVAPNARAALAVPLRVPRFWRGLFVAALYVGAAVFLAAYDHERIDPDLTRDHLPTPQLSKYETPKKPKLPEPEQKRIKEKIEALKKELAETKDPELKEILQRQLKLLEALKNSKLNEKEGFKKLAELEEKLKRYKEKKGKGFKDLEDRLSRVGKELEKNKKLRKLDEALKKKKFEDASNELKKLNDQAKNDKERKALKQALKKALDRTRDKREKKIDKLKNELAKLKRKMEKNRLKRKQKNKKQLLAQQKMKNRLNRMQKELQRLMREMNISPETQKFLQRLARQLDNPQDMQRRQNQRQKPMTKKELEEYAKLLKRLQQMRKRDRTFQLSKARMIDIRDWLRRQQRLSWGQLKEFERLAEGKNGRGKNKGKNGRQRLFVLGKNGQKLMMLGRGRLGRKTMVLPGRGGDEPGKGTDPNVLGKRTPKLKGRYKETFQKGKEKKGLERTQTVFDAARRGFSTTGYKKVYQNYRGVYEEKMARQKIPKGYEAYVRRYMELIRPR